MRHRRLVQHESSHGRSDTSTSFGWKWSALLSDDAVALHESAVEQHVIGIRVSQDAAALREHAGRGGH